MGAFDSTENLLKGVANGTFLEGVPGLASQVGSELHHAALSTVQGAETLGNSFLDKLRTGATDVGQEFQSGASNFGDYLSNNLGLNHYALEDFGNNPAVKGVENAASNVNSAVAQIPADSFYAPEGKDFTTWGDVGQDFRAAMMGDNTPHDLGEDPYQALFDAPLSIGRGFTRLGAEIEQGGEALAGGADSVPTANNPYLKAMFGDQPIETHIKRISDNFNFNASHGVGGFAGGVLAVGETVGSDALMFTGLESGPEAAAKAIAKASTPEDVTAILKIAGKYVPEAEPYIDDLVKSKNAKQVGSILEKIPEAHLNLYGDPQTGNLSNNPEAGPASSIPANRILDLTDPIQAQQTVDALSKELGKEKATQTVAAMMGEKALPTAAQLAEHEAQYAEVAKTLGKDGVAFTEDGGGTGYKIFDDSNLKEGASDFAVDHPATAMTAPETPLKSPGEPEVDPRGTPTKITPNDGLFKEKMSERLAVDNALGGSDKVDELKAHLQSDPNYVIPNDVITSLQHTYPGATQDDVKGIIDGVYSHEQISNLNTGPDLRPQARIQDLIPTREVDDPNTVNHYKGKIQIGDSEGVPSPLNGPHEPIILPGEDPTGGHTTPGKTPLAPITPLEDPSQKAPNLVKKSLLKSPNISDDAKDFIKTAVPDEHNVLHNDISLKAGWDEVNRDPQNAFQGFMEGRWAGSAHQNAVGQALVYTFSKNGDTERLGQAVNRLASSGTDAGRAVQILSRIKGTVADFLVIAQKAFDDHVAPKVLENWKVERKEMADMVSKTVEPIIDEVATRVSDNYLKQKGPRPRVQGKSAEALIKIAIDDTQGELAGNDELRKLRSRAVENLVDKVSAHVEPPPIKSPVADMVNELYRLAKNSLMDKPEVAAATRPIDLISYAIKNSDEYMGVWDAVQAKMKIKYADNPEALAKLEDFFHHALSEPYSEGTLNKAIAQAIKEDGVKLVQLVKGHYLTVDAYGASLKDKLVKQAGLSEEDAAKFAKDVEERIGHFTTDAKEKALQQMLGEKQYTDIKSKPDNLIDRIIAISNAGGLNSDTFGPLAAQKLGLKTFNPELMSKIGTLSDELQAIPLFEEGIRNKKITEIFQTIRDASLTSSQRAGQNVKEFRYMNILANPATQVTKTLSHVVNSGVMVPLGMATSTGVDYVRSALTGAERTRWISEVPAYFKGLINSIPDAAANAFDVLKGEKVWRTPDITSVPSTDSYMAPARFFRRVFEANDAMFSEMAKQAHTQALMKKSARSGIRMSAEKIDQISSAMAAHDTFREALDTTNKTEQGHLLTRIDQIASFFQRIQKDPLGNIIVPFVTLPTQILKQGIEYSPLGFATIAGSGDKTAQIGKALAGSLVLGGALGIAMSGDSTWSIPNDKAGKDYFFKNGFEPYSMKVGDSWVSYSKLGTLAVPFALASAYKYYSAQDPNRFNTNTAEKILPFLGGVAQYFGDQSYVQNVGKALSAFKGDPLAAKQIIANIGTQFIPLEGLLSWVNQMADPANHKATTVPQMIAAKIPGLSEGVPTYPGETQKPYPIFNATSPVKVAPYTPYNEPLRKPAVDTTVLSPDLFPAKRVSTRSASTSNPLKSVRVPSTKVK